MNNPVTIKKRKKLRHARHKREAMRYHAYLYSQKFHEDLKKGMQDFINKQVDMPSEFVDIVNQNFKELLY
jgi:hypothetical protein